MPVDSHTENADPRGVAVITAGATGIGRAIAARLIDQGFMVHVCDIDASALEEFLSLYPTATTSRVDVANAVEVGQWFDQFSSQHGWLDVLINNAGIAGPVARVENIDPTDWDRTLAVGINAAFYVTRRAVPLLKKAGGGSIINMASTAGLFGCPMRSPYVAAKWAMIGFTKTLATELGPFGIRVNAICPGSVNGPRIERVIEREAQERGKTEQEIRDIWTQQISMRCFVDAEDIAAMVAFLVSADGAKISGQSLGIDGNTESLSSPVD